MRTARSNDMGIARNADMRTARSINMGMARGTDMRTARSTDMRTTRSTYMETARSIDMGASRSIVNIDHGVSKVYNRITKDGYTQSNIELIHYHGPDDYI